jgi:hypothetical protein
MESLSLGISESIPVDLDSIFLIKENWGVNKEKLLLRVAAFFKASTFSFYNWRVPS